LLLAAAEEEVEHMAVAVVQAHLELQQDFL
jgi:hypothetical protein